jgi:hypothetical protein
MISQILSIFSPIGISPVTNLCLMLLIFFLRITSYHSLSTFSHFTFVIPGLNFKEGEYSKKTVLQNLPENTSDHYPIKLSIDFENSLQSMKQKDNKPGITKVKWEKVDKEWYEVILRKNISSIKHEFSKSIDNFIG